MARSEIEEFQLYYNRLKPIYHQLFNMAHAITGNREQAEYALQYALLDCWSAGDANASHHGFREGLRSGVIRAAAKNARRADPDWDGLLPDAAETNPLMKSIAQEPTETRRLLALRYGCGMHPRRIARITGMESTRIHTLLRRFDARTRRRLSAAERRKYDMIIARAVKSQLAQPGSAAPEMGSIFRTFQADAASVAPPNRLPGRILRAIVALVLALVCIVAFWLCAVLIQPPVMENASAPAEIAAVQAD